MTEDEARAEAIRRWGNRAKLLSANGAFSVGTGGHPSVERGHGEELGRSAGARAHAGDVRGEAPTVIGWWDCDPGLSMSVGCRACRASKVVRLRVAVIPPFATIMQRADAAEANIVRQFRATCRHVPRTLAFDRTGLWLWVQRLPVK